MCFGASSKNTGSGFSSDPRAFYRWWKPPEIETPTLKLNEDATDRKEINARRIGTRRLQIPLAHTQGTGLGIPTSNKKKGGYGE